ncbi:hypothetical protein P8452_10763 [Trifolium repens]|nr:hypothetical protein P8452_10763 [Trifolium repens]
MLRRCTHQRRKSTKIRVLSQLNLRNWSLGQTFPCLDAFYAGQATTYKIGLDLGNSSIKATKTMYKVSWTCMCMHLLIWFSTVFVCKRESTVNILSSRENLSTINLEIFFIQRMTLKMPGVEDDFAMSEVAEALSRKERSFKADELMQFYKTPTSKLVGKKPISLDGVDGSASKEPNVGSGEVDLSNTIGVLTSKAIGKRYADLDEVHVAAPKEIKIACVKVENIK